MDLRLEAGGAQSSVSVSGQRILAGDADDGGCPVFFAEKSDEKTDE